MDETYGGLASNGANQYMDSPKVARMPTLKERLDMNVKDCEDRLKDARRAREILDANPALEELLNIMQKGRF